MLEKRPLGNVTTDFLSPEDFQAQCEWWLETKQLHHVVTLNPEMVMEAQHNEAFQAALQRADIRVPDGAGLIWARWYLRSHYWALFPSLISFMFQPSERVTGIEAVLDLARLCEKHRRAIYLLGGTAVHVERSAAKLRQQFPALTLFTSPPHTYSPEGPDFILSDIIRAEPAVVLVAYGSPNQTIWIDRHRQSLPSVRIAVGVGGAFAILSEETPRAPQWLRRLNLEWLWRLLLEPSRLPRIWQAAVSFPLLIRKQKLREHAAS